MTKKKFNPRTLCIVLTFIFLYMPIGVLVLYSFNSGDSTAVFQGFSLRWYKELLTDTATLNALKNTLLLAVLSAVIATIIGTAAAYGISKMRNKYIKNITMSATQIPMINPEIVTGISMMLLFVFVANILKTSSFNGFWTVLIAHITFNLPYVILLVLPKFKEMDKSLPEAALDLGCTPLQSFFKVELPAIMPGIIAGFIMAFTLSIDDFVISYFTTGSGFETLPIRIYSMTKKRVTPDMYALSTLIFVTILVLLLVSNLADGKNKIELSKKAKRVIKIVGGSTLGVVAISLIVLLCINAGTKTITVNVYNWGEYISDGGDDTLDVNKEFEEWAAQKWKDETGEKVRVQVNYTTYASNEDLYAKLANGAGGYDVIIPSDYMLEKMHKENMLQPLDLSKIPNKKYLSEQFDGMFLYGTSAKDEKGNVTIDEANKQTYGLAYTYGVIGIVYNYESLKVNAPEMLAHIESGEAGWEVMFGIPLRDENGEFVYDKQGKMTLDMQDPENKKFNEAYLKLKGQILQFNNSRDAFGAGMYYLGINVNSPSEKDWQALYGLLAMQKSNLQGYVMDEIYNKMEKGESWIAAYYAGDCLSMIGENEDLSFFYPKNSDGEYETNIFADAMCIPVSADRNEDTLTLAHWYIDYMMSPEIAYANAEYIYYGCPYDYTDIEDYTTIKEDGTIYFDNELYEQNLEFVQSYQINMGMYEFELDSKGNPKMDMDGNYVPKIDENGNMIINPEGDYFVIYYSEFMDNLADMFDKYQYKDLTKIILKTGEGEKSQLTILNEKWEDLKIESASMVGIYIVCGVIALAIIGFIVYAQVIKRKRRKLYWGEVPTPKARKKDEKDPDFSDTTLVAIEKAKKRENNTQK